MIRLIMYDLDGTLLDTASEIAAAVNMTLTHYGAQAVPEATVKSWVGHGAAQLMRNAWQTIAPGPTYEETMQTFTRFYQQTVGTSSRPFPQVMETLQHFRAAGVLQAVITNKESVFTRRVLKTHGMNDFFALVVSGDTLPVKKPDPAMVRHCLQTLAVRAEESLFVGDSDIDVATAKAAGVRCWVVPYGYNGGRDIGEAGADRMIADMGELPLLLDKMSADCRLAECDGMRG